MCQARVASLRATATGGDVLAASRGDPLPERAQAGRGCGFVIPGGLDKGRDAAAAGPSLARASVDVPQELPDCRTLGCSPR